MRLLPEQIKLALASKLSGIESHRKMLPSNRKLYPSAIDSNIVKFSSVLLLLCEKNREMRACLIKRSSHMKHHAGQMAMPGGKKEPGETDIETALRETEEEIGINKEEIEILGALSELFVEPSGFVIKPFVGWIKEKPKFVVNNREVEKIMLFPIERYKEIYYEKVIVNGNEKMKVPCFIFEGEIIWGATAMILNEFFELVIDNINLLKNRIL